MSMSYLQNNSKEEVLNEIIKLKIKMNQIKREKLCEENISLLQRFDDKLSERIKEYLLFQK